MEEREQQIAKLLKFYFRTVWTNQNVGLRWDNDNDSEMDELASLIVNGK